ncbi:hypothetical protein Q4Q39_03765 [Flavivirga amylovorans]|uniref:Uncharacterized protein n=1 Tax=Flavivirga amylovorans TaxID=870486 RepID=A0ABT8WXV0_9FLAO|nr:hypothetical protein [Flavivirga amylovorans]MDO5986516.1 hypothetical protein [Flavivirga amylovorans]
MKLYIKKLIQTLLITIITSTISYAQNSKYIDDFGNSLSKTEFKELKKKGGIKIRLKNNNTKYGMIPDQHKGYISDSLKFEITGFLELNSNIKIAPNDTIIIEYAIDHKCNIVNNINLKKYIKAIEKRKGLLLFVMVHKYDEKIKTQIVDNKDLIKHNFFNYMNWHLSNVYKCGGTLLIYPNNSFLRIYGEHNPMEILKKL